MNRQQHPISDDVKELLARNKAYKTTLEYCPETCDEVDKLYVDAFVEISKTLDLSDNDRQTLVDKLHQLNNVVKDQGTRKLRQAFVNYVLTTSCSKLENQKD